MVAQLPNHIDEDTPLEERYLYPGDWWGGNDSGLSEQEQHYLLLHQLADSSVVAITDNDADGLGTMAVIERAHGPSNVTHIESGHSNGVMKPAKAMNFVLEQKESSNGEWPVQDVYITDLCLDTEDFDEYERLIDSLSEHHTVHVYDHHQWEQDTLDRLQEVADDVDVRQEEEVCATDITVDALREQISQQGDDVLERIEDFAAVTRDNDLWIKDDPRSDNLSDFAFWAEDAATYIETVREYGADIMQDDDVAQLIRTEREEKQRRIELAVDNADWYAFHKQEGNVRYEEWGGIEDTTATVALAYGDVYASAVGNQLTNDNEDGLGADLAVIIQPWNKVSLRAHERFPLCSEIASLLGGGGHPTAAGCTTDILGANGSVPYPEHWRTQGAAVKQKMLETIQTYIEQQDDTNLRLEE